MPVSGKLPSTGNNVLLYLSRSLVAIFNVTNIQKYGYYEYKVGLLYLQFFLIQDLEKSRCKPRVIQKLFKG